MKRLYTPFKVNQLELKNRVIMSPMSVGHTVDGFIMDDVVGSAVAGALSMTFGCALRAPHGGIFVFPVVDHAALYCVALAVGSVLGAVILSLVKKTQSAEVK